MNEPIHAQLRERVMEERRKMRETRKRQLPAEEYESYNMGEEPQIAHESLHEMARNTAAEEASNMYRLARQRRGSGNISTQLIENARQRMQEAGQDEKRMISSMFKPPSTGNYNEHAHNAVLNRRIAQEHLNMACDSLNAEDARPWKHALLPEVHSLHTENEEMLHAFGANNTEID